MEFIDKTQGKKSEMTFMAYAVLLEIIFIVVCIYNKHYSLHFWRNPVFEIMTITLIGYFCNMAGKKVAFFRYLGRGIIFLYSVIFLVQCYYYAITDEFITILGLENLNQFYLLINTEIILSSIAVILVALTFSYALFRNPVFFGGGTLVLGIVLLGAFLGTIAQDRLVPIPLLKTRITRKLANAGDTPIIGLGRNYILAHSLFEKYDMTRDDEYPFLKGYVYKDPFPFKKVNSNLDRPNVVLLFTEGTSARLIGSYNEKFKDVTPNINKMASHSMVVQNYFNHTAATFRGTQGQLISGYPRAGGWEEMGWMGNGLKSGGLADKVYQSLPKILNRNGYYTSFISPHKEDDPYTKLLENAGFKSVFTRDSVETILGRQPDILHDSVRDDEMYQSLQSLIKQCSTLNQPFFIVMYTFETHTNIDTDEKEKQYADGSNMTLNTLHNLDYSFGKFWNWFINSEFAGNTIVILTADHTHYYDHSYLKLVSHEADYNKAFIDKIPLVIYDPVHDLPEKYDADGKTSLSITPTIMHLLDLNDFENSFMGKSIFDKTEFTDNIHVAAIGMDFYGIYNNKVYREKDVPIEYIDDFSKGKHGILTFYKYEKINQIYPK